MTLTEYTLGIGTHYNGGENPVTVAHWGRSVNGNVVQRDTLTPPYPIRKDPNYELG